MGYFFSNLSDLESLRPPCNPPLPHPAILDRFLTWARARFVCGVLENLRRGRDWATWAPEEVWGCGESVSCQLWGYCKGARRNPGAPEDEEWGEPEPSSRALVWPFFRLPLRSCAPRASPA